MKYAQLVAEPVPQSEPLDDRQVENNAGGFVYALDRWARLDRFLVLGSDAPTYYQAARALTRENAKVVAECYDADAARTVARIVEISDAGRAPKNDPAIFALALGATHMALAARQEALRALPKVCRTSTHLFQFATAVRALGRGWGRSLKRAIANWYDTKEVGAVAYQAIKYRSREDYTHKRLLDMSHAPFRTDDRKTLYHWIKGLDHDAEMLPPLVRAHLAAMTPELPEKDLLALVRDSRLPWEALPTGANANPKVWEAMLPDIGLTALIRNLGNMTRVGTIKPLSEAESVVVERLENRDDLHKSRVHPFSILMAAAVYSSGRGVRGSGTWEPSQRIVSALDGAFHAAFANVEPTGKRFFIALDVSGSMSSPFMGSPLMCSQATAALSLVTMAIEKKTYVAGFADRMRMLDIRPKMLLAEAVMKVSNLTFGGTDCALPMIYALEQGINADIFVVMTDNETWAGSIHPSEALKTYRKKTGINAKLIVVGMTSTGFSIADPNDAGMLDIVGFDANCPALIADFARQ
jgi:60 kDa SS-A/Ro ribonucleoprotein